MAAVLTPKHLSFPHNILHDNFEQSSHMRMEKASPSRPSLPSITSLIEHVDKHADKSPTRSPSLDQQRLNLNGVNRPQPSSPDRTSFVGSPRNGLPPTPPLPGTSSFDFTPRALNVPGSPTTKSGVQQGLFPRSPESTSSQAYAQTRSTYPPIPESNQWSGSTSPVSSRRPSNGSSGVQPNPPTRIDSSYSDVSESTSIYGGLSRQRPLPVDFPPSLPSPGGQQQPIDPQVAGTQYQHHHHYPVANTTNYPQSTDRYQCPTCQKAFSRPSSLKIHTYSHTGEKPFKCKFDGCGKYFSVRSNMKRHEKGCHGVDTSSASGNSPQAS